MEIAFKSISYSIVNYGYSITKHSNLHAEKSAVTSPLIRQLRHVLWYELKCLISTKMAECFVLGFVRKSVSYNIYRSDSSSWILTALWVAVSTNVDISNEIGMAKDILLKPRSKQRNRWHKTGHFESKNQRQRKNYIEWQVCSSYSMFPFYFTSEILSWGNLYVESSSVAFYQ